MKTRYILSRGILILVSGGALAAAAWAGFVDPALYNWGCDLTEQAAELPGDQWVSQVGNMRTRAITIHAAPKEVWPWLLQLGNGRGGFYTFDLIEKTRTIDQSAMKRLDPGLQGLKVGDSVEMAKGLGLKVVSLLPERALVLGSPDPEPHAWSWAFVLEPGPLQTSRLLIRERYAPVGSLPIRVLNRIVASVDNLMSWKMLHGIKARAEAAAGA
ncbi:MAG: SRPBCC family protein [Candidatus Sericytochromatia bacterium]